MTIGIFLILMLSYNVYVEDKAKEKVMAISEVSKQVSVGQIKSISIIGTDLTVKTLQDEEFKSQKDYSESLENTLSKYGVTSEQLQKI